MTLIEIASAKTDARIHRPSDAGVHYFFSSDGRFKLIDDANLINRPVFINQQMLLDDSWEFVQ
jgi:hypothetical protein